MGKILNGAIDQWRYNNGYYVPVCINYCVSSEKHNTNI